MDTIQPSSNGILPTFTAWDNRADFFEPRTGTNFSNFIMPLLTRHDYNFAYRSRPLERADGVSEDWFVRNYRKQFIEPHALAAAAGYDDRTEHYLKR
jgi:hypothetical protein